MFQPSLTGEESQSIHERIRKSIIKCNWWVKRSLFKNIVLSGGSTIFRGFSQRLKKEMSSILAPTTIFQIIDYEERKYGTWLGGAALASLSTFKDQWISREEYDEHGSNILDKKYM
ncbi:actin, cytoskeletal 3 [Octopus bimaculoides]|uniref:actin, cytoskeletal 3 n=1 Tax=Octopus bimaculoides TaxID=37653 RepID=UPI00071C9558|nr:actin, cytoskeletal 3 [Octopus bimaculoides]|eukprot:XP_014767984.1 PREDICTED: actin, cytoskeletal 3-like [Octopus bimaculoides]